LFIEYHGQKYFGTCKEIGHHTCLWMSCRESETSGNAYGKKERWNCDHCHAQKMPSKEIPIPTEKAILVKLLNLVVVC
jgi:hypothetical protein